MLISKNRPAHRTSEIALFPRRHPGAVEAFESAFATSVGAPCGIAFPFCRIAMKAVLEAARPGAPRVVLPAYTCVVVAHAVVLAGYEPSFVDIGLDDFNADAEALAERIDASVGAVIPTHMFGTPINLAALERRIERPLLFIEDGALGLHAAFRPTNPLVSSVSVYSFGSNKHLSTIRGGMVVTHDRELADRIRRQRGAALRSPGLRERLVNAVELTALTMIFTPHLYGFLDRFRSHPLLRSHLDTRSVEIPAFPPESTVAFSDALGALGLRQLAQRSAFLQARRAIAERYDAVLYGVGDLIPMRLVPESHLSHYVLRVPDRDHRHFPERMKILGVEVGRTLDYSVPDLLPYRRFADRPFPTSARAAAEVVNLPNYPALSSAHVDRIIDAVRRTA